MMNKVRTLTKLAIIGTISSLFMIGLFMFSENKIHRNNAFTRRFPHHPISKKYDLDIGYDSYYIAGYENQELYLGNHTAPLHVLKINLDTKDTTHIRIQLEDNSLPFRSVNVKLFPPYFFVMDGTIPTVFRGEISKWKAKLWMKDKAYFTNAIPVDSNKLFIRSISSKTNETILGTLEVTDTTQVILKDKLLERQIDGVFDVDGIMLATLDGKTLGYVYFYRNQFLILNNDLELIFKEETIDTVKIAQINLSKINKKGEVKMESPPVEINKSMALTSNQMLINSNRLGKYEEKKMLNQASIIDLYDWKNQTYEFSFYIYDIKGEKVKEFKIYDNYLIALIGSSISIYELKPSHFENFFNEN